jgi:hypothetical protein
MERTTGGFGSSPSMKFHPQLAVTRFDSHLPLLSLRPRIYVAPLPAGSIPASGRLFRQIVKPFGILASICLLLLSPSANAVSRKDTVVVTVLDSPLPSDQEQMEKFLWEKVASRQEAGNFGSMSTRAWKSRYKRFADALSHKAADQKLDSVSLRKVLDLIFAHSKGELAYLPVAAYHATMDGRAMWIVTVQWEFPLINNVPSKYYHVRVFAFDEEHLTQVGFITCG